MNVQLLHDSLRRLTNIAIDLYHEKLSAHDTGCAILLSRHMHRACLAADLYPEAASWRASEVEAMSLFAQTMGLTPVDSFVEPEMPCEEPQDCECLEAAETAT